MEVLQARQKDIPITFPDRLNSNMATLKLIISQKQKISEQTNYKEWLSVVIGDLSYSTLPYY